MMTVPSDLNMFGLHMATVPDKKVGSCLDPELPRNGLRGGGGWTYAGLGPPDLKEESQLEPSRDGGDMKRGREDTFGT